MQPLAVYVHIPFCTVKCGYCDFNAYAGMDNLKDAYGAALVAEVHANAPLLSGRSVASIGFGGGTPSEVAADHVAGVVAALREHARLEPAAELTLEANPGTLDRPQIEALRAAGVTRLSIGAQSFRADELRFLDRIHSPQATAAAVELARKAGFESIGLDLIYGLPGQTLDAWIESLVTAICLGPDHISIYALTVEDGTPLARRVRKGEVTPLDPDAVADLYEAATDSLAAAGYLQYELSNWARPGHHSRHNMVYWTDGDYLAIGAGAHGYLGGERYENVAHPRAYIAAVEERAPAPQPGRESAYRPGAVMAMADWFSLRLRLLEGFEESEFEARFGVPVREVGGVVLDDCVSAGVLDLAPSVRLTRAGRLLHGEVSARFLAHLQNTLAPTG
ncbi:MAG: radical SAM family heme chaperone HemW [Dehalococcoidia bacterium]|nr:radical SAM family heme chaperone HemW [Dehalococcoidia bacterium]